MSAPFGACFYMSAKFASRAEACSFAGIEAMAYSLPIVSTNEDSIIEMFGNAAVYADMTSNYEINLNQYEKHMLRIIEVVPYTSNRVPLGIRDLYHDIHTNACCVIQ